MSVSGNESNLRKSQLLDEFVSRSASKFGGSDMDTFMINNQDVLDSPEMKELMISKVHSSTNGTNDYELMRDIFFEAKRPGTLKL